MFTWISKYTLFAAAAVSVAACGLVDTGSNATIEKVRLPNGVLVEGSRGWCVAPEMLRATDDANVVVLGSCAAIASDTKLPAPDVAGIMTVSVDNTALGSPPTEVLDAFFSTSQGRATLARDGRAESIKILESLQEGEALFLHAVDRSGRPAEAAEDYWRAVFDIDGRFVTVSLVALDDEPIEREAGIRTLEAQVEKLRIANRSRS